ncbi:hypothetical protein ACFVAJ_17780 [Agromyces sp. NPDC057679]|uniref:hypothetical protein n=1 Tax=Agromyces sp. NPDC057679 TaxID=3346207 RepID=UPI00366F4BDC
MSIERDLLTRVERDEYDRRQRLAANPATDPKKHLPGKYTQNQGVLQVVLVWAAVMLSAGAALIVDVNFGFLLSIPAAIATFVGLMFMLGASNKAQGRSALRRWADGYLDEIGYAGRTSKPSEAGAHGSSGDSATKSKRQMQHEWYGSHSELNWRDRETAEMYGMDVDTYVSNVLENDKD